MPSMDSVSVVGVAPEQDEFTRSKRQRAIRLAKEWLDQSEGKPLWVDLVPEPDNRYDKYAVLVYASVWGVRQQFGYLPAEVSHQLYPEITSWFGSVQTIVGGDEGKNWGARLKLHQRKDKANLFPGMGA